jgi:Zn-finger nucleic acid-binding protein
MELTCPKCHGSMRTYERNGVHVDQCTECRGIFLDRGELEKLVDAENAWNASDAAPAASAPPPGAPAPPPPQQAGLGAMVSEVLQQARAAKSGHQQSSSHDRPYEQQYGKHPRRKKSFLEEFLG